MHLGKVMLKMASSVKKIEITHLKKGQVGENINLLTTLTQGIVIQVTKKKMMTLEIGLA